MVHNRAAMTTNQDLHYTETEIRSFLPTGWDLIGGAQGAWDPKKKTWRATVLDNVDFDWPVEVKAGEGDNRLDSLRRAMDRVYRERLG